MTKRTNTFDVVIATRNRYDALKLSIPLMLSESRQPQNFVVVDSSDNHEQVRDLVYALTAGWHGKVVVLHETPPSSSRQRNIGLNYVTSDVVIFPDDDSLVLPGAFEAMMRIYDLDTENRISGVCSAEAISPPEGLFEKREAYELTFSEKAHKLIAKWRYALERIFIPDPLLMHGRNLMQKHTLPEWLAAENAVPVEYMTGFRMSFRTPVIRKYKFTEVFSGYCLAEDVGASFLALRDGLLVGARNALIYHHKFPGKRAGGYFIGLAQMINNAYVLAKSMQEYEAKTVFAMYIKSLYKLFLYFPLLKEPYGRARIRGAARGIWVMGRMLKARDKMLDELYIAESVRSKKFIN